MSDSEIGPTSSLFRRGVEALGRRRFLHARRLLTRAVQQGGPEAAWAGQELIQTFLRRGDADQAELHLRSLLPEGSAHLHHLLGYLYRRTGRPGEAAALQVAALKVEPDLVGALVELGWHQVGNGRDPEGQINLGRAVKIATERHDEWGEATAVAFLATRSLVRFDLGQAVLLLPRAVALKRRAGDSLGLARALSNIGLTQYYLTDHTAAIASLRESLALERRIGDRATEGISWNNLGNCYRELHDLPRAEDAYRRAAAASRRASDQRAVGAALGNLALVSLLRGDRRAAERQYRASLRALEGLTDPDAMGGTLVALLSTQTAGGRPEHALKTLSDRAHTVAGANARTLSNLAHEQARALLRMGRLDEARSALSHARLEADRVPGPQRSMSVDRITIDELAGRIELAAGRPTTALRILAGAHRRVESLLKGLGGSILRAGLLEASRAVVDAQVYCELANGGAATRRAWRRSATAKARELRRTLRESRPQDLGSPVGERAEIEAEARRLAGTARMGASEIRQLRRLQQRYLEALEHEDPLRPDLTVSSPQLTQPDLGPDTAILEYHVTDEGTVAFTVHRDVVRAVKISWGRERLTAAVDRVTRPLLAGSSGEDVWAELDAFDLDYSLVLFRTIVAPSLAALPPGVSRLVIVPDGPLRRLPFEALVCELPNPSGDPVETFARFAQARYLGDQWTVSYTQSSLLLAPAAAAPSAPELLALAHSPETGARLLTALGPRFLGRLPGAAAELRALAAVFSRATLLTGSHATPLAYERAAPSADIIHLAAHAFADVLAPGLSGVVLAGRKRAALDVLSAERVAHIPLKASLVTLSACDSGTGRDHGREGVVGLVRAFHQAGAVAVLASLWPVDDVATRDLMRVFYGQLVAGHDRAYALAEAKRSLRFATGPAKAWRAHPYFWAAMILVDHAPGESSALPVRTPFRNYKEAVFPPRSLPGSASRHRRSAGSNFRSLQS